MNYATLRNEELIKYALIDAPMGSLAALLAARFEKNIVCVEDVEKEYAAAIETDAFDHAQIVRDLETSIEEKDNQIEALETELDDRPDPLLS